MDRHSTPLATALRGLAAAAAGTAAMDAQQYVRYRLGGGTTGPVAWEFGGITNWDQAATPGKIGKRIVEAWTQQPLDPQRAGLTNNLVHWGFGMQWGPVYGVTAASLNRPAVVLGPPFGALVWLFGYAVLPLGNFYKPIWQYSPETLARDLFSHLVYGTATALTFRLLSRR